MSGIEATSQAGPSNIQQVSEIIDVDALPDEVTAGPSTSTHRSQSVTLSSSHGIRRSPSNRRHRVIYVADSDDEGASRSFSGPSRSRLISPPAPARQQQPIPPVPVIPRRFSRRTSHANQFPVIFPRDTPFEFEAQFEQRPQTPQQQVLPPRGAPRSQHQPALGLGGALIAWNRRENENRQNAQEIAQNRSFRPFGVIADTIMHYFGTRPEPPPGHVPYIDYGDFMGDWGNDPWDAEWLPDGQRLGGNVRLPKASSTAPAWVPSYTHPGEPEPGFTFHFEPKASKTPPASVIVIEDDGQVFEQANSTPEVEQPPVLACARCLDPLVIGGHDGLGISEEEAKKLRVWALRCGHMLDGKCIEEIMRPDPATQYKTAQETITRSNKRPYGKGKGKATAAPPDPKGKGKAVEGDESLGDLGIDGLMTADTSIRSRLRPRGNRSLSSVALNDVSMASVASTPTQPVPARPMRPLPRRGAASGSSSAQMETSKVDLAKTKPKGKARARKPVVEAKHEWFCPVSGCCKEHGSVRMRGEEQWKMDGNTGAIALYV
ncbi:hypothetical protein BDY19DRAFT_992493 [Irpex rosettiformis]|uniref:Uncharacterized protein n=1 Tax=Irpex rosettiformis TaxID=378272 RepID=A0ACB8U8I9_9APHY|nr:hypothetical protein BDY19DRAFT_992493 [Irpex rosettiformis]